MTDAELYYLYDRYKMACEDEEEEAMSFTEWKVWSEGDDEDDEPYDCDDSYDECGFNPYMGCYDFDC